MPCCQNQLRAGGSQPSASIPGLRRLHGHPSQLGSGGSGAAYLGMALSLVPLTSRPGGPLSPGSPRLPFWPRSRSDSGRNESELPS